MPGLYFEGQHWWIANGLANLLWIGIVLDDWYCLGGLMQS